MKRIEWLVGRRHRWFDVRHAVRPPGAAHRLGWPVMLLHPATAVDAADALTAGVPSAAIEGFMGRLDADADADASASSTVGTGSFAVAPRRRPVPDWITAKLAAPCPPRGEGPDQGSERIAQLAWGLFAAGRTPAEVIDLIWTSPLKAVAKRRRVDSRTWLVGDVTGLYRKWVVQHRPITVGDANELRVRIHQAAQRIDGSDLNATDIAVLGYVLGRAADALRLTDVGLAVRDVAVGAGIAVGTASASLARLRRIGVLRRHTRHQFDRHDRREGSGASADRYTINLTHPVFLVKSRTGESSPSGVCSTPVRELTRALAGHDAWRRGAVGKAAAAVFALLPAIGDPMTRAAVASTAGRSEETVRKQLARLRNFGLAVRDEDGRWARHPDVVTDAGLVARLDVLAAALGTAGKGTQQRLSVAVDRAEQRAWVDAGGPQRHRDARRRGEQPTNDDQPIEDQQEETDMPVEWLPTAATAEWRAALDADLEEVKTMIPRTSKSWAARLLALPTDPPAATDVDAAGALLVALYMHWRDQERRHELSDPMLGEVLAETRELLRRGTGTTTVMDALLEFERHSRAALERDGEILPAGHLAAIVAGAGAGA